MYTYMHVYIYTPFEFERHSLVSEKSVIRTLAVCMRPHYIRSHKRTWIHTHMHTHTYIKILAVCMYVTPIYLAESKASSLVIYIYIHIHICMYIYIYKTITKMISQQADTEDLAIKNDYLVHR